MVGYKIKPKRQYDRRALKSEYQTDTDIGVIRVPPKPQDLTPQIATLGILMNENRNQDYQAISTIIKLLAYVCLWGCLSGPNTLENHLMKLDILWHTVSLGF